ncbi:MAG: hypothetical protein HZY77_14970 [Thiobacillus sp.]|uniref:hypothetical protein n=1 Tax=Thiobacillus sp. TaxID=924 RepID=UPI00168C433D|nr:hypothetical protein [Thiobacillus sp.]QLQ03880.1 MAG: hypothetical protein HZY77_14970 [Thiobacillus sp.]
MLSTRTIGSLVQFLELFETDFVLILCGKHGLRMSVEGDKLLTTLNRNFTFADKPEKLLAIIEEIARTDGDLRSRVSPKYRFTERFKDLTRCLQLDGYLVTESGLVRLDPSIDDLPPIEDDLTKELNDSGLTGVGRVIDKINDSAESFRKGPANHNSCLNDIRVALESLAAAIAESISTCDAPSYDPKKWGSVVTYLKSLEFITPEEERGLVGVYGFVSPGSHRPVGLSEEEMARLGRHLALSMCWFLVKQFKGFTQ